MPKPIIYKICVLGNCGVGKSTLISKGFKDVSNENFGVPPKTTIGVTIYQDIIEIDGVEVVLQIWELSGNERFKFLFKDFVRGVAGGIFIYDITDKSSLDNLNEWIKIFRKSKKNVNVPLLMIGNKADLQEERKISLKRANRLASSRKLIGAIEISAMNSETVKNLFINFARVILRVDPKRHLIDIFRNELDLRILILMQIFKELSLTEITYHLGKSKATMSRRTRELIRLGLLESHSKDDEIQAGNIKRKYYRLSKNFDFLMEKKEFDLEKAIKNNNWEPLLENLTKYSYEYKKIKMISEHLNNYIEATESHLLTSVAMEELPMIEIVDTLMEGLENNLINFRFISEKQYEKVKALSLEFHSKLDEILKNDDSLGKPYLYMNILLNILGIAKFGSKTGLYILGLRQHAKDTQNSI